MKKFQLSKSVFTISLDFELYWGVRDLRSIESYRENLEGVKDVIPKILQLFKDYEIEATWATVGFLFLENFQDLLSNRPIQASHYTNQALSPYKYAENHKNSENNSFLGLHFAPALIELIQSTPGQEIGSHTFSHYYGLEDGQKVEDFNADLQKNKEIASTKGITLSSIVFPRNQVNSEYDSVLKENGILSYRGNQHSYFHRPQSRLLYDSFINRGIRYLDAFFPILNHETFPELKSNGLINIPATRFLQPYSNRRMGLEHLKLRRIKKEMHQAAMKKQLYHLWWHPHNFGRYQKENLEQLEEICSEYKLIKNSGAMISRNMHNLSFELLEKH